MYFLLFIVQTNRWKDVDSLQNKANVSNPMQKGKRRQKLHDKQNDIGNPKKESKYKNFDGNSI